MRTVESSSITTNTGCNAGLLSAGDYSTSSRQISSAIPESRQTPEPREALGSASTILSTRSELLGAWLTPSAAFTLEIYMALKLWKRFVGAEILEGFAGKPQAPNETEAYRDRVNELHEIAEDDGIELNRESRDDFWKFIKSYRNIRQCAVILRDNGNLRAIWRDGKGTRMGLQFLGSDEIEYVILKEHETDAEGTEHIGRTTIQGVGPLVEKFKLNSLLHR